MNLQASGTIEAVSKTALKLDCELGGDLFARCAGVGSVRVVQKIVADGASGVRGSTDQRLIRGLRAIGAAVASGSVHLSRGIRYRFLKPEGAASAMAVCGLAYRKPVGAVEGRCSGVGFTRLTLTPEIRANGETVVGGVTDIIDVDESTRRPGGRFGRF